MFDFNFCGNQPRVVIFDYDGTLSDGTHRLHLLPTENQHLTESWIPFNSACVWDSPIQDTIDVMNAMYDAGFYVIILTGRSDHVEYESVRWLKNAGADGYSEFLQLYNNRNTKEVGCHVCGGLSPREFMIWISETVMKPRFGDKVFAIRAYETYLSLDSGDMLVFSDGGFPDEVAALVEFGATVKLFRLHRDGYDFSGDSRNYIYLPELIGSREYEEFDVKLIDGDIMSAVREIASKVGVKLFE